MTIIQLSQIVIALSVIFVWTIRWNQVKVEFEIFGLSKVTRNTVGLTKLSISLLLIIGLWIPQISPLSSLSMGLFMISAQYFHWRNNNSIIKKLPSLVLFILCLVIFFTQLK